MGFGDEGKGITTDFLCSKDPNAIVTRFSGGQQAGHTVYMGENLHVFSSFGSGTLRGNRTYISEFCTIDPISIVNEYNILKSLGVEPTLMISDKCPVTTPFEVFINQNDETSRTHGTCGKGIWATFKRELDEYSLTAGDLNWDSVYQAKLDSFAKNYYRFKVDLDRFIECVEFIRSRVNIHIGEFIYPKSGNHLIFEGSQGLLLDQNHGIYPHITPSNTGLTNLRAMGYSEKDLDIYLVSRAYQTRHGNGFMTNEKLPHNIKDNPYETNVTNPYQGEFRRGVLDLDLYEYALWRHNISFSRVNFVLTNLDQVENAYCFTHKGKIHHFVREESFIEGITSILGTPKSVILSRTPFSKDFEVL